MGMGGAFCGWLLYSKALKTKQPSKSFLLPVIENSITLITTEGIGEGSNKNVIDN
jgi:hypothetical protein